MKGLIEAYCKHSNGEVEYLGSDSEYNKDYCEFSEGEYILINKDK